MWSNRFQFDDHVGDGMLDLRVICHRAREPQRALAFHRGDALVERASGESVVNISKAHQGPGKDREYEGIDSRPAGRKPPGRCSGREQMHSSRHRVVAAGRAHAQNVPGLLDGVSRRYRAA